MPCQRWEVALPLPAGEPGHAAGTQGGSQGRLGGGRPLTHHRRGSVAAAQLSRLSMCRQGRQVLWSPQVRMHAAFQLGPLGAAVLGRTSGCLAYHRHLPQAGMHTPFWMGPLAAALLVPVQAGQQGG